MASRDELRVVQTTTYFQLLRLRELNRADNKEVTGLDDFICLTKASMLEPDIAWVEKNFAEANKGK